MSGLFMLPVWHEWLLIKCCLFWLLLTFFLVFQQGDWTQSPEVLVYFENFSYSNSYLFSSLPLQEIQNHRWISLSRLNVWIISVIAVEAKILLASFHNPFLRITLSMCGSGRYCPTFFCNHRPTCLIELSLDYCY